MSFASVVIRRGIGRLFVQWITRDARDNQRLRQWPSWRLRRQFLSPLGDCCQGPVATLEAEAAKEGAQWIGLILGDLPVPTGVGRRLT
jgi:hypothetical protein